MKLKSILSAGFVLILGVSIWTFGVRSCGGQKYASGLNDQAILTAARWIELIENTKIDAAKELTGDNPDQIIARYRKELGEIGEISDREFLQRNFLPTPGGNVNQIVFKVVTGRNKTPLSERIFVIQNKDKKWQVVGTRFLVPLPRHLDGGEDYVPQAVAPAGPAARAAQWFADYDAGKLSACAKYHAVATAFANGMFFFNERSVGANVYLENWLKEMRKAGKPQKRQVSAMTIWRGFKGMSDVDIVRVIMLAEYPSGVRRETLWLFKDNFFPDRGWYVYHAGFGKTVKKKNREIFTNKPNTK